MCLMFVASRRCVLVSSVQRQYPGVVIGVELVNEAFVTIPIDLVQHYYVLGYEYTREFSNSFATVIGDSFRFQSWNDFMFPPHFR